jgi:glycosyltransferase involved in cell wall biosynthesis
VRVEGAYGNNRRVSANEERLRVALLDSIPAWGGGQKWDVQTARALTQRGHFVAVACARDGALAERAEAHGVPTWTAPVGRFGWRLGSSLSLARFLRRQGIDLVIANVGRDLRLGAFACGLAGASLLQRRGLLRPVRQGPWNRWLLDHFVRRVLVNSPALERLMLESAPYLAGRVVRLPNAIELRAPDPVAEADADSDAGPRLRSELRIALDAPLVAAVGRLTPMKGFAHLLDAWPRVREAQRTARLVFFGEGEQERELRERAERLGVADSVCFAGFREDTAALHAAADLFVLPSVRDESMSHAVLEAMAYGCPVVVSEVASGGYEAAHAEGACRVVATGDADALARALVELLSEPALRERMARSAREWVLAEHTVERATERLEQVLREVRAEARRS